jgi:hypothetical protein
MTMFDVEPRNCPVCSTLMECIAVHPFPNHSMVVYRCKRHQCRHHLPVSIPE